jgi:hypothetical protein
LAYAWIVAHCVIPDGFDAGKEFVPSPEQMRFIVGHYDVNSGAERGELAPAFRHRRSQLVRAQKWGKSPLIAAFVCFEGVGPAVFDGWAQGGEVYDCRDHGCGCGWGTPSSRFDRFVFERGDPFGARWPTPLIQITATSEDQCENTYDALRPMIDRGPLAELISHTGEQFIRLPGGGRIDIVTTKANSRLGQRVTFVSWDETGIGTEQNGMAKVVRTQRRGLAGMGGRGIETTNPWDPSEQSVGQQTYESQARDVLRDYRLPPAHLSWGNKRDRYTILRFNYAGSPWALRNLVTIEAECEELNEKNPAEAERFFGNRVVAGSRAWLDMAKWDAKTEPRDVLPGTRIALGWDGSDVDDWSAIRAETLDGYQFTPVLANGRPTYWDPKASPTGRISHIEVMAAFEELALTFDVVREYWDPPYWQTELDDRQATRGKRCVAFPTNQPQRMFEALEQFKTDVHGSESRFRHDGCEQTGFHLRNAVERPRLNQRYILGKASDQQKIDLAMSSVLAHKAACDAVAAGENVVDDPQYTYVFSSY